MLVFEEREKSDYPKENLSKQRREPVINSILIEHLRQDLNSVYTAGRPVLSPLRQPWSSKYVVVQWQQNNARA